MKPIRLMMIFGVVFALGCDDGGSQSGPETGQGTGVDLDAYLEATAEQNSARVSEEELEADGVIQDFEAVDVTAGLEPFQEEVVTPVELRTCGEDVEYNDCRDCMCENCPTLFNACGASDACWYLIECASRTSCLGPGCLIACSEDIQKVGGAASKAVDLWVRTAACSTEMCFEDCFTSGGISAGAE